MEEKKIYAKFTPHENVLNSDILYFITKFGE